MTGKNHEKLGQQVERLRLKMFAIAESEYVALRLCQMNLTTMFLYYIYFMVYLVSWY
jgi:hypothetical protein